jgi:hypothetical protein
MIIKRVKCICDGLSTSGAKYYAGQFYNSYSSRSRDGSFELKEGRLFVIWIEDIASVVSMSDFIYIEDHREKVLNDIIDV